MNSANQQSTITQVLTHLHRHPDILIPGNKTQHPIKVLFSDKKKRFTEFYRIRLEGSPKNGTPHFWIRVVKNKPTDVIHQALDKQFGIMQQLFRYFSTCDTGRLHLSCCKPIALFKEFRAVITQECSGMLFNRYLQRQFPVFRQKQILKHFYNCGIWLHHFHECFKQEDAATPAFSHHMDQFKKRFSRYPDEALRFITCCHNDYSPRNIFSGENSLEVIDFVGVENGFPEEDLLFFKNYILKAKFNLLYPRPFKEKMTEEFNRGYKTGSLKKGNQIDVPTKTA